MTINFYVLKAWGHGPHENPLPKAAVPRAKLPMRDVADNHNLDKFQHPVDIKNLPKRMRPVPNKGKIELRTQDG